MEDHRQYKTRVTKAMRALPRDHFIEMSDSSLVLGRSIPPTNAVSEILEHADVGADSKVLHIGTGAGYVTALLSKLAAQVISIENNPSNARYKKLPIINVLRDKLNMEDTVLYRRLA